MQNEKWDLNERKDICMAENMQQENEDKLNAALSYQARKFSVIPVHTIRDGRCSCGNIDCDRPGKHPRVNWKEYMLVAASKDQIRIWWKQWPYANIGIVTGRVSNLAVVDVDGPEGEESLKEAKIRLPVTPTVQTGGGGRHLYYQFSERAKTGVGILTKVDIRAEGGYIVAPPSNHRSGNVYRWADGLSLESVELARFPDDLLEPETKSRKLDSEKHDKVNWSGRLEEGERNSELTKRAGSLLGKGYTRGDALEIILSLNETKCNPPLPAKEVQRIVNSIADMETRRQGLGLVNSLLGMPIPVVGVRKFISNSDQGRWELTLENGRAIEIGYTEKLLQFAHVRTKIADAIGHVIEVKRGKFNDVIQAILDAAEEIFDSTDQEEMLEWVKALVNGGNRGIMQLAYDADDPAQKYDMVKHLSGGQIHFAVYAYGIDGRLYLRLSAGTLYQAHMLKPKLDSARDISRRLQADLGFEKKRLDVAYQGERARANVGFLLRDLPRNWKSRREPTIPRTPIMSGK